MGDHQYRECLRDHSPNDYRSLDDEWSECVVTGCIRYIGGNGYYGER